MVRVIKAAFAAVLATAMLALAVSGAYAATGIRISAGPTSGTLTGSNLTLTGTSVGTVIMHLTMDYDNLRIGTINCTGTHLVPITTIDGGVISVTTPAGVTGVLLTATPWLLEFRCVGGSVLVDGVNHPLVFVLNVQFQINLNAITRPLYSGSLTADLSTGGSFMGLTGSTLVATPGGSSGAMRGLFTISPAFSYTLV